MAYSAAVGQRLMHWPQLMQLRFRQRLLQEGGDLHLVRPVHGFQDAHFLHVDAGPHAAAAADALVHVPDDGEARGVEGLRHAAVAEPEAVDPVFLGQLLQLADAVADAGVAVAAMLGQQQVEDVPPGDAHRFGVGLDLDGRGDGVGAGGLQRPLPLHFHHTDAADARHFEVRMMAQRRDADADALGRLEDGGAERDFGLDAVDGHRDGGPDGFRSGGLGRKVRLEELAERSSPAWQTGVIGHGSHLQNARGWTSGPPNCSDPGHTWRPPAWCWPALSAPPDRCRCRCRL